MGKFVHNQGKKKYFFQGVNPKLTKGIRFKNFLKNHLKKF